MHLAAQQAGRLVPIPDRAALGHAGLTPAPLPGQLRAAANRLLDLTHPLPDNVGPAGTGFRGRLLASFGNRDHYRPSWKDDPS